MNEKIHKSGFAALIGRPNAGKSTLLNQILGTKLIAVTPRPQTTRNRIFGIYDREDTQIVFQDTPGLLEPKDALHQFMTREAERALKDADVAVWLIDSIKGVTARERGIATNVLSNLSIPLFAAFNKIDKINPDQIPALEKELEGFQFDPPPTKIFISALLGHGVGNLLRQVTECLQEGPKFYPPDQLSDRTQRFFVEEIVREKAFLQLRQELPYSLAVRVEEMKERENGLTAIRAVLFVERETQKRIVLGKKGAAIKHIGIEARKEIETMLDGKVFLELWVKVSERWRKKEDRLREFGYTETT